MTRWIGALWMLSLLGACAVGPRDPIGAPPDATAASQPVPDAIVVMEPVIVPAPAPTPDAVLARKAACGTEDDGIGGTGIDPAACETH